MVARHTDVLFQSFTCKSMTLKNRIVMAPMTRSFAAGGLPGDDHVGYYRRRAEGGVGLILSEGTVIDRPGARNDPGVPFFHGAALDGWSRVIGAVHAAGGAMGPQLWHAASAISKTADWVRDTPIESPSGLHAPGEPQGGVMSEEDIADSVAAFTRAATDAQRLGFDTVEIHGAHGYLVDQFFWEGTNQRSDRYGGASLRERSRYAAEVVAAIRAAVGPDYPIILRISQWKQQDLKARLAVTPEAMIDWLVPLVEAGVDILHCSQRRFWTPEFPEIDGADGLNFAGWAKKLTGAATISVGSVGLASDFISVFQEAGSATADLDALIRRMEREEFDLIAVGRALISNPDWANKVRDNAAAQLQPFKATDLAQFV